MERILKHIAHEQYINDLALYTVAVNLVRSLPDARDGLKPSSRRILYALDHDEKAYNNHMVKSASATGTLMKHYHPHGDSIYNTFKTLINWFEVKMPLVKGQGNFGTISGDEQAAARYTECSLNDFGLECVIGALHNSAEVVDWNPTYNNLTVEPQYLPVKVPLLLINGILGGIGTGIKADLPSHNMNEVIDATLRLMDDPFADAILVPDHCLPCEIIDTDWKNICNKGYGSYRARATMVTTMEKDYPIITITSLPTFNTDAVCEKINAGVLAGKFPQIVDVFDESQNEHGVRIVIKLKKGSDVNFVKEALYKYTPCEQSFRVNFEVVLGTELVRFSYKSYLQLFIRFAIDNKIREYSARHYAVSTRLHKLEAFIKIVGSPDLEKIIKLIRNKNAKNDNELIELLINKYKLTDIQSEYIINASIKQLSKGYLERYKAEYKKLSEEEKWLEDRIANEKFVIQDVKEELLQIKAKYGSPRICKVVKVSNLGNIPEGIFNLVITENNYVRKLGENDTINTVRGDKPKFVLKVSNTESVLLFDNKGRVFKLPVHKIPIIAKSDPGIDIKGVIKGLTADIVHVEYEPNIIKLAKKSKSSIYIAVLTKNNTIKKLNIEDFITVPPSGIIYSKVNPDDEVVDVQIISNNLDVIIYSNNKALRISANDKDIPCYKRNTLGVSAMNTKGTIEGMSIVYPDATSIIVITRNGRINKIGVGAFQRSQRNKSGNNIIKLSKGDSIQNVYGVTEKNVLSITTTSGVIDIPISDIRMGSSISQGDKIISTKSDIILKTQIK